MFYVAPAPRPTSHLWNETTFSMPSFAEVLPNMQEYFANHCSMQIFFTSGTGTDP